MPKPLEHILLELARISNLPTVWTNVAAGIALSGGELSIGRVLLLGIVMSLFYTAGMFLNDAFDRRWDLEHRPERPIPRGAIRARSVFISAFCMMGVGLALLEVLPGWVPFFTGLALSAVIVIYNAEHKGNPLSPLLMGACRAGIYATAAVSVSHTLTRSFQIGVLILFVYVVTLTTVAKREARNPKAARWVVRLIAGLSLLDAAFLLATGHTIAAVLAVGAFFLTRRLQRRIPGT